MTSHDDRRHDRHFDSRGPAKFAQCVDVARTVVAEEEVRPLDQSARLEPAQHDTVEKLARCEPQQLLVGRIDNQAVDAALRQKLDLAFGRR